MILHYRPVDIQLIYVRCEIKKEFTNRRNALKVEQLTPDGRKSITPQATGWEYHLEGFSGTVFEVIK